MFSNYFSCEKKDRKFFSSAFILFLGVLCVWLFFIYLKTSYDYYRLETHIASFEERNEKLKDKIEAQRADYLYYSSEAYLEKYAKGSLGKKNLGEEVIVVEEVDPPEDITKKDINLLTVHEFKALPNQMKWWIYFFGDPAVIAKNTMDFNQAE